MHSITNDILSKKIVFVMMAARVGLNGINFETLNCVIFQKFKTFRCTNKLFYCSKTLSANFNKTSVNQSEKKHFQSPVKHDSFLALLRKSKFIDLGDPVGKVVLGTIYRVVDNDLYIDFGWKFPTVCSKPQENANLYKCGTKVKLLIKDLELSTKFLGADNEITLLEADCKLLGLANTEMNIKKKNIVEIIE